MNRPINLYLKLLTRAVLDEVALGLSNGARNLLDVSRVGTVWAGLGSRLAAHPEMIGSSCGETIAIKRKYLGIITVQGRG